MAPSLPAAPDLHCQSHFAVGNGREPASTMPIPSVDTNASTPAPLQRDRVLRDAEILAPSGSRSGDDDFGRDYSNC